jgi:ABC-type branched-subunit amino acid transport system substrate-binding protein
MWHRRLLIGIAACALLGATAGCSSSTTSTQSATGSTNQNGSGSYPAIPAGPIKLGVSLALSGPSAAHGEFGQKGLAVGLAQFMKAHPNGIDGHKIVLDIANDQGSTTVAASVAKQFISDHDAAVIEPSEDPAALTLQMQIWAQAKMPVIGYTFNEATYADGAAWPYDFNVDSVTPTALGQVGAQWLAQHSQYKKIAVLTDGTAPQQTWVSSILQPLESLAPADSVVKTVSIGVGAVDASTQVAQLKAANPDIVLIAVGVDLGPIWNAFHSAGWTPPLLAIQNALYDGYSSLGSLAKTGDIVAQDCIPSASTTLPQEVTSQMQAYVQAVGAVTNNMMIFADSDSMVYEAVNYAISKFNSVSPDAIKAALNGLHNQNFIGNFFPLSFSSANHFGLSGALGAHVCSMAPLADSPYNIPTYAP